jgi:hypothetical protein
LGLVYGNSSRIFRKDSVLTYPVYEFNDITINNMLKVDSSVYYSDSLRGIVKLGPKIGGHFTFNWRWSPATGNYSMTAFNEYLIFGSGKKVYLVDPRISNTGPAFLDSLNLHSEYTYKGIITTKSGFYIKGIRNEDAIRIKLSVSGGNLSTKYSVILDPSDFSITENGEKLMVFSKTYNYWITDSDLQLS